MNLANFRFNLSDVRHSLNLIARKEIKSVSQIEKYVIYQTMMYNHRSY